MNQIDRQAGRALFLDEGTLEPNDVRAPESMKYWHHPCFPDLGLFTARFTQYRYELHTHPTYVIALIMAGCERIRIGRHNVLCPVGTIAVVNPEEWHDGEQGADEGWTYRTFYPSVPLMTAIAGELGQNGTPTFSRATIEDSRLAEALAAAHEDSTSQDAAQAESSLLIALRRLIVGHGDWSRRTEAIQYSGARQRFLLYEELIESELGSRLGLRQLAEAAGVTRFQVIRDFKEGDWPHAFNLYPRSEVATRQALYRTGASACRCRGCGRFCRPMPSFPRVSGYAWHNAGNVQEGGNQADFHHMKGLVLDEVPGNGG